MSLHVFANFVTSYGTAANNRAETEGNVTTLQKLLWQGETHSTVSAEAIRFALRRRLAGFEDTNRSWNEDTRANAWKDHKFEGWASASGKTYIDDDLLGYMIAEAAKDDGSDNGKGSASVRRAVLEVTRAVSLTPWAGDVTFNAASPGATPSAQKKGSNPVPYGTELHATRYQYGIALTPTRLRDPSRAAKAIDALCNLGTVAGNHGRYLFDFSPDAVVFRVTDDPAPRLLYCFETPDEGKTVTASQLAARVLAGDIAAQELIVAGIELLDASGQKIPGVTHVPGVKAACAEAQKRMQAKQTTKG
ncbi:MAG: type I-B CRISPR-associated protein Cas7/Cst2/DevR [Bacteroidales bacterium]|nr:type I-B CRISPR-associated protein Cas7/Cst2/DevR [Bacteroidales bacterium]